MFARATVTLLASAALAQHALAFNSHRHLHQLQKKDIHYVKTDVVIITEWTTVTKYDDDVTEAAKSTNFLVAARPSRSEAYAKLESSASVAAPSPVIETLAETPAATPNTLFKPTQAPAAAPEKPAPEPAADPVPAPAPVADVLPGGKRGFAYNDGNLIGNFLSSLSCPKCTWRYNWNSEDGGVNSGLNFAPMLWSPASVHSDRWAKNADASIAKGATHLLSFNECDNPGQCNMDAHSAATAHVKFMNPYASKAKIGSPAITNSNIPGQGLDWLREFVSACKSAGCHYDFCATHWYSPANAAQTLFDHLAAVHEICEGKEVWLTEFAPIGSDSETANFLSVNLPKLDSLPYLARYSYFMLSQGSLLSSATSLSSFGKVYASA